MIISTDINDFDAISKYFNELLRYSINDGIIKNFIENKLPIYLLNYINYGYYLIDQNKSNLLIDFLMKYVYINLL